MIVWTRLKNALGVGKAIEILLIMLLILVIGVSLMVASLSTLPKAKAADLSARPRAALCFHWKSIGRQVRVSGRAEKVSDAEADAYYATRPRLSQLGAWASKQSRPMRGYYDLEQSCAAYALRYPLGGVPRPPFWSGFRIVPDRIEFWRDKPFRRHERVIRVLDGGQWGEQWLYP